MSFPETELWDLINEGWSRMTFRQRFLWEVIKISPEEWELAEYGPYWVVGIIGSTVLYYNHGERGFNLSPWNMHGAILTFGSLQYDLAEAVQRVQRMIDTGEDPGPWDRHGPLPGRYAE